MLSVGSPSSCREPFQEVRLDLSPLHILIHAGSGTHILDLRFGTAERHKSRTLTIPASSIAALDGRYNKLMIRDVRHRTAICVLAIPAPEATPPDSQRQTF